MATSCASRTSGPRAVLQAGLWRAATDPTALGAGGWVLLVTALGGLLRGFGLGANALWVDEYGTLEIVSLPFSEILNRSAEINFCPPLFFWSVYGVVSLAGLSEASLRAVSALSGTLTIPVIWLLVREITGNRSAALLAALLLALNPLHIWYSQEARPYALMVWLGSSALLFLVLAMRRNTLPYWAGFVGCMTGVLLTHTLGAVVLAVAWGWAILSRPSIPALTKLFVATLVVSLFYLPFAFEVMTAVAQADGTHSPPRPLTGLELPYTLFVYLIGYSFGPSTRDIQNLGPFAAVWRHPIESVIGGVGLACILSAVLFRPSPGKRYFVTLLAVPMSAILLASAISGKAYQPRYALSGLVGFCGLAAGGLYRLGRLRVPAVAGLVTLSLWADAQWFFAPEYQKDDSRAIVAWLADRLPPGSTVAVAPPYVIGVLSHYSQVQEAGLSFVRADSLTRPSGARALLLTRLHHVLNEASIRSGFRQMAGPYVKDESVAGYRVLWRMADSPPVPRDQR